MTKIITFIGKSCRYCIESLLLVIIVVLIIATINKQNYKFTTAYYVLPVIVVETKNTIASSDFAGKSLGPIIYLNQDVYNNETVLIHELCHVKQFYRGLGFYKIFMDRFNIRFRIRSEGEAYLTDKNLTKEAVVNILYDNYNTNLNKKEIADIIRNI